MVTGSSAIGLGVTGQLVRRRVLRRGKYEHLAVLDRAAAFAIAAPGRLRDRVDAALAGTGIARLPSFVIGPDIAAGRLVPILEEYRVADLGIYAVYPAQRHLTPKLRAFIDFVAPRVIATLG